MTLISAYIELFIQREKSGGEMSGGNVRISCKGPGLGHSCPLTVESCCCTEGEESSVCVV